MTIKQNVQKPHWSPEQHNSYNFTSPHYDPIKLPWDHNLKKLKSRLPKDDSTKIFNFSGQLVFEKVFKIFPYEFDLHCGSTLPFGS